MNVPTGLWQISAFGRDIFYERTRLVGAYMNPKSIWSALEEAYEPMAGHGFPAMERAAAEMGLEAGWMTWVAAIWLFGPEPIPPPHFFISHKKEDYQRFGAIYPLERFVVRFGELSAYRDDSHIAAWQAHNIEGHAWEVLTYLWRGEFASADTWYEKLGFRRIPHEIYSRDLEELAARGWAQEEGGDYHMTAEGKRNRQEADEMTDRYFFAPWACLSEKEQADLFNLATRGCARAYAVQVNNPKIR